VKFLYRYLGGNGHTDGAGSTAKINNHARLRACCEALPQQRDSFRNKKFCAQARHKNTGINGNTKTTKAGPANNVFKRLTGNAPVNPFSELHGGGRFGQQQLRFFFGENATSRPEQSDNFGKNGTGK
jgi:hypothetical protein